MIKGIAIEKLFGIYNYDIKIPQGENVSILTGPNGYGKTTILNIIRHLLNCEFWFFYFLEFRRILILFDSDKYIEIQKSAVTQLNYTLLSDKDTVDLSGTLQSQAKIALKENQNNALIESFNVSNIYIQRLRRTFMRASMFHESPEIELEDILEANYCLEEDEYLIEQCKNLLMFVQEHNCNFVKEQRILVSKSIPRSVSERRNLILSNEYTIDLIAKELKVFFSQKQVEFAQKSQRIDADFIQRLVSTECVQYENEVFYNKLDSLKEKLKKYRRYELVTDINLLEEYPTELKKILSLYIDDMENKISVFDEFYERLATFDQFISNKVLSNKIIRLNARKGISIYDTHFLKEIPLHKLSSGEQNLIILYYKLTFGSERGSLLLIDEPENSLHVAWITQMLDDYLTMAEKLKCQIILATHSPALINDKWDMVHDLYLEQLNKK